MACKGTWRLPFALLFLLVAPALADTTETHYFVGNLAPGNEVPAITNVDVSGTAIITAVVTRDNSGAITGGTVWFDVNYSFASPEIVNGLDINDGAAGVNGPITIDTGLENPGSSISEPPGQGNIFLPVQVTGGAALNTLIDMLAHPSAHYVNLYTNDNSGGVMRDQLQETTAPSPNIIEGALVSAASFALDPAPLAPGSIAALFGKYLNTGAPVASSAFDVHGKLVTSLGGTQVMINGIAAPIFFSYFNLIALQIPAELAGSTTATVQVIVGGRTSATRTINLDAMVPGIFSVNANGQGAGAVTHADGTPVDANNPAQPNEVVVVYLTGMGLTAPPLGSGLPAALNTVPNPTVTVDGESATVQFAGRTPSLVGLDQLNVQIPSDARADNLSLVVTVGSRRSNAVTIGVGTAPPPTPPSPPVPPPPPPPPPPTDPYGY